ncbi:MAG TPA: carboxypeptidase-like regulatory domain-containing protein [Candidatus Solibacter sp.]|nr:carboxypeptidase-like regulatory domain-containing protein [Candidatus Solibacter sp.]
MSRLLQISMLLCVAAPVALAQFDSGQIAGFVRDPSQGVVIAASVTVTNEGNGEKHRVLTNNNGYYVVPNLFVGSYSLEVEAAGFKKYVQSKIQLSSAAKLSIDVDLTVGAVTDRIEVSATGVLVQSETATVGRTVETKQIENLTMNGRNPVYLALLKPGVIGGSIGTFDPDSVSNGGFSINGARSDEYVVMVDGAVATRTRSSGSMLGAQDVDTVQEVQILTANFNAEYGRSSGGQIRFVTKSGTTSFHGDLVENFRNSALDANTWTRNHATDPALSTRPQPFRFNQFGFDINGPVFVPHKFNSDRSKLFFLYAEEWTRRRDDSTNTYTVPTPAMRGGDLSGLLSASNPFFGRSRVATDPDTKAPFPNNMIPANRISPNGRAMLNAYPVPTPGFQQGTANWIGAYAHYSNLRKDTFKVDYLLNSKHRISVRGTHIPWEFNSPFEGTLFAALWSRPNRTGALSVVSTFSPTLVNEFTFSANSDGLGSIYSDPTCGPRCSRTAAGFTYPFIFPGTKWDANKLPSITIDGLTTVDNGPYPGTWSGFVYAWANNTTKVINNHTIKFGVFIERSGQNDHIQFTTASAPATINENGSFRFLDTGNPLTTGLAMANALLGNFNDYAELGGKPITPWVATAFDWYVQDSWKVTKKLTIEYGVRHSIWPPWHSRWNSLAEFLPTFYDPSKAAVIDRAGGFIVSGDPYNGIVLPGSGLPKAEGNRFPQLHTGQFDRLFHGLPEGLAETHWTVFQPRLGLAYGINSKTSLRAGLGMFANRTAINRDTALGGNAPFQPQQIVINGSADAPAGAVPRQFPFTMTIQDPVFKIPTAWNWNATVQRELPGKTAIEIAYVGRRGIHNQRKRNINQLLPGTIQANTGVNANALRPYLGLGILGLAENSGHSQYNGMQISAQRRFAQGLQFDIAYTLSRLRDDASSLTDILPNAYSDKGYYGISDLDRTHVLIISYIYELPFRGSTGLVRRLLGNWELSGINQMQSGSPFSVRQNVDYAGVGAGSGNQFWNLTGDPSLEPTAFVNDATWFNKGAFAQPAAGTFGQQPRNILRNPGFWEWDLGVRKNFPVTEKQRLQFRTEVFNVVNHPNWGGANANPTSASFGKVTSKSANRTIQLALKYIF